MADRFAVMPKGVEHNDSFGAALRRHRLSAGLSMTQLASRIECHQTYIGLLERGERTPTRSAVLTLTSALGLTTSQTDRLLYAAEYAPETDYQTLYEVRYGPFDARTKWCWVCQSSMPIASFSSDRNRYDGLQERCRACDAERRKASRTRVALSSRGAS